MLFLIILSCSVMSLEKYESKLHIRKIIARLDLINKIEEEKNSLQKILMNILKC